MNLIVGLGNLGKKYENTRHNLGFMVMDEMARGQGLSWRYSRDLMCYYTKTASYILIKPAIFMNKSGESILAVCNFYNIEPKDVLVVHDDLDLDFGKIRVYFDGTSAGHHGVDSAIESLGTLDFGRVRVGISHPDQKSAEKYVLEQFSDAEKEELSDILKRSVEAVKSYMDEGIEATMNKFN